jgi:hypothetical protein
VSCVSYWACSRKVAYAALLGAASVAAQPQPQPPAEQPRSSRAAAPLDLTGQWVAIVNEDWRWRMVTPPKGDYASVPLNDEGRRVADLWDAAQDGGCEAYGAAGLLRMPLRMRVAWDGDEALTIVTDLGEQTRRLSFDRSVMPGARSFQGHSVAEWIRPPRPPGGQGLGGAGGRAAMTGGHLRVTTTNMLPGWLRRNGVPYSENAVLTEHFDRFTAPNGDEWLMVTTIVDDPAYLTARFVTSSHFRREASPGNWRPVACKGA